MIGITKPYHCYFGHFLLRSLFSKIFARQFHQAKAVSLSFTVILHYYIGASRKYLVWHHGMNDFSRSNQWMGHHGWCLNRNLMYQSVLHSNFYVSKMEFPVKVFCLKKGFSWWFQWKEILLIVFCDAGFSWKDIR